MGSTSVRHSLTLDFSQQICISFGPINAAVNLSNCSAADNHACRLAWNLLSPLHKVTALLGLPGKCRSPQGAFIVWHGLAQGA